MSATEYSAAVVTDSQADRKMLWLRAYARKRRWDEETILVPFEMECTVRSYRRKAGEWETWARDSQTSGHAAYVRRQAALWTGMLDHAERRFRDARTRHSPQAVAESAW